MQQIHDKVVFHTIRGEQLTKIQKHGVLQVLMILKQKRCRKIKGRAVADGRKQISVSKKSDVTSPTSSTESVLITPEIDTAEVQDVAVIDAPGEFLTDDM